MHPSLKYGISAAAGVAAIEYMFTTAWFQGQTWSAAGDTTGIAVDMLVAGAVAAGIGMLLH